MTREPCSAAPGVIVQLETSDMYKAGPLSQATDMSEVSYEMKSKLLLCSALQRSNFDFISYDTSDISVACDKGPALYISDVSSCTITPGAALHGSLVIDLQLSGSSAGTLSATSFSFTSSAAQTFTWTASTGAGSATVVFLLSGSAAAQMNAPSPLAFTVIPQSAVTVMCTPP